MSRIEVRGLDAGYDDIRVLHQVDLTVESGTTVALLGPSGCGKSTLLRVLAGFHRPTAGTVQIADAVVSDSGTHVAPERRRIGIVVQEGALFPHLTVSGNIGFGLPKNDEASQERLKDMLALTGLAELAARYPHELSGGQQQRVALARALAPRPSAILLDEPFSSLDSRLRDQLREDVRELLTAENATAVLVTHDRDEALGFADSVAVLRDGRIRQQASGREVYARPADPWVAQFVGDSLLLPATFANGAATTALGVLRIGPVELDSTQTRVLIRHEQIRCDPKGAPADVVAAEFRGPITMARLLLSDGSVVSVGLRADVRPGDRIGLAVDGEVWPLAAHAD